MVNYKAFIRKLIKIPFGAIFYAIPWVRKNIKNGVTVFVFHEVTDHPSQFSIDFGLFVSRETFYKQIAWITHHFTIIHPKELVSGKPLPESAAVITFDDGMLTSFEHGLFILEELNIPSVFFLNMGSIMDKQPLKSAVACYLARYDDRFESFCRSNNINPPFHLTLTPKVLDAFEARYGRVDNDLVTQYQGCFACLNIVKKWNNADLVVYGNHLYEHWNSEALSNYEFQINYIENKKALSQLENNIDFFAFPNGQPGTCFSERHISLLKTLGVTRIFSSSGNLNTGEGAYLIDRVSFGQFDDDNFSMWFKIGFNHVRHALLLRR